MTDPEGPELVVHQHPRPGPRGEVRWIAELYPAGAAAPCPVAVAWLTDLRPMVGMVLDFILVPDPYRRRGHASRLIRGCRERWPDLELGEATAEAGAGLLAAIEGDGGGN
jgi:hypothetical protein